MKFTPRPYQQRTTQFILRHKRCALWQEMGLGKTAATLAAIKLLRTVDEVKRVLVVAPLRVAHMTWPDEIKKWDDFKDLTFTVLAGTPRERRRLFYRETDVHLINPELLPWLVDLYGGEKSWPYDMIVIDEPRGCKQPSSLGFKTLRKVMRLVKRMVQLTGTPAPNGLHNLWCPAFLLDGGHRLGRTYGAFEQRWFFSDGVQVKPRKGAEQQIHERMSDIVVAMKTEDYLTLPPLVKNDVRVELPAEAMDQYRRLEDQMFLELEDGSTAEAFNAAALTNKCLQASNGAVYKTDSAGQPTAEWGKLHDAKLDAVSDIVEQAQGAPVLVAYWYRSDLERLQQKFKRAVTFDKNPETLRRWNAGEIPILLAHPQSAGHGLNMQDGGNILVWFSMLWSLELYEQMNKRLHRSGQTKPTYVHHLLGAGTIDELVLRRLQGKATVQQLLFEALKERRANVRRTSAA